MQRRSFIAKGLALSALGAWQAYLPAWAGSSRLQPLAGVPGLDGRDFDLVVSETQAQVAGRAAMHIRINDQFPAPLLRWQEGDKLTIRLHNHLKEQTSIHWHGLLLPSTMDGVPGVSFAGVASGETFTYQFPLKQAGTYWYHSHSGFQEQIGHYGPIIIDPVEPEPFTYDREYIVMLSDWSFEKPERIFSRLKKMSGAYNYQQRTIFDFFRDVREDGLDATGAERMMWGDMRMNPRDLADVTAATYTYLVNGHSPSENWTGLFKPGETVRLRFINASAMSIFNVRIPGLPLEVVMADGLLVKPIVTDEFQLGTAETFDVLVRPDANSAYTIMAESNDFFGYARATLTPKVGMSAQVPALRPTPTLTMKDMGMASGDGAMAGMNMGTVEQAEPMITHEGIRTGSSAQRQMNHEAMDHDSLDHSGMNHSGMDHSAMGHDMMGQGEMNDGEMDQSNVMQSPMPMNDAAMDHSGMDVAQGSMAHAGHSSAIPSNQQQEHALRNGVGVVNVAENPVSRLHERPLGLEAEPHRVLVYSQLASLHPNPDQRPHSRELQLHLTSNMERYMWSFDGIKFSEVDGPIQLRLNERVRLTFVNDTMMPHPIHLHGMFFDVVTDEKVDKPRKHTLVIKPAEKVSVDLTADAPGLWAFHCHLLYHMHAGMMRVVQVSPGQQAV